MPLARSRFDGIDALRGLVMILMALDHVRDYFGGQRFDPLDLTRTTPALFFTRWITHYCAPTFVLLAGAGAYLYGWRGRPTAEVRRFLLTRGLWLIVLELTVVRFGWLFNLDYGGLLAGQVIWAIGWSMLFLALLVGLPRWAIVATGAAIVSLHNLLDPVVPAQLGSWGWFWVILHEGGVLPYGAHGIFVVAYPLLPWFGIIALGYGLGPWLTLPPPARDRRLLRTGLALTAGFVVLSLLNCYGEPSPWVAQRTPFLTVLNALDVEKYPPSLLYVLMTVGPALLLLVALDRLPAGAVRRVLVTFGRVPLFYYVLHLPLIHGLALLAALALGIDAGFLVGTPPGAPGSGGPLPWGFSLPVIYAVWLGVVAALYPLCRWFAGVKARSSWWGWSYL